MAASKRERRQRAALIAAACMGAVVCVGAASCSLGLDEALIDLRLDAAALDNAASDGLASDAGDGALPELKPEAGLCTKDEDCKGTAGCLTAKCDVPRKACVLQVCRTAACTSAVCDTTEKKCGMSKSYKFRANQFAVGAAIGCGGALGRCFAAVYPYVFVGTTNGVVAFATGDPQNPLPAAVPIYGLGFVPAQIVASGTRVFFVGTPVGVGGNSRVSFAWLDVPADPFATSINASTYLALYNRPSTDGLALFPRGNDTALLIDLNAATSFAATPVEPPLKDPLRFESTGIAATAGALPAAVSGSRLVMGQIAAATTAAASFGFVLAAGSGGPQTTPDVPIPSATPASAPQVFAQSPDGAVFWAFTALTAPPPAPPTIRAARGHFLVAGAVADFDPTGGIDLEVYPAPPLGTLTVGPVAMLDAKTAMVATSSPTNPAAVTNIGFVTRTPLALLKNADTSPRRFPITLALSQIALAGSNGLGYVLAVDPAAPNAPQIYVLDPACAP